MFLEAKLISFSDTPLELADVNFEEPLYQLRPACVFAVFWSSSRLAVDHDHLEQNEAVSLRLPYPDIVHLTPLSPPRPYTNPSVLACAE